MEANSGRKKGAAMMFAKTKFAETKFATVSKALVIGAALLLASSALAATKGSLALQSDTTVNGTQLKAGDYKLEWDGTGPNVEVSFMQGKKVLAKVPAHVVDLPTPAVNSAAVVMKNNDGTTALAGVRFEGKKFALQLGESADGTSAGSSK
jgi:hypothetical protein